MGTSDATHPEVNDITIDCEKTSRNQSDQLLDWASNYVGVEADFYHDSNLRARKTGTESKRREAAILLDPVHPGLRVRGRGSQ